MLVRHVWAERWKISLCNLFHFPFKSILGYFILLLLSRNSDLFKGPGSWRWPSCLSCLPIVGHWPLCLCRVLDPKDLYFTLRLHLLESFQSLYASLLCSSLSVRYVTEQMCQDCAYAYTALCFYNLPLKRYHWRYPHCTYPHCLRKSLSEISGK